MHTLVLLTAPLPQRSPTTLSVQRFSPERILSSINFVDQPTMLEEGEVDEGPAHVSRFVHVSPQGGTVAALTGQDAGAGATTLSRAEMPTCKMPNLRAGEA